MLVLITLYKLNIFSLLNHFSDDSKEQQKKPLLLSLAVKERDKSFGHLW